MKFELHSRIERTARGTGRKYKQWVFVGMTEFTGEFLQSQQRKGQYVMFETSESVYRVVASEEEIEALVAIEAEAAEKEKIEKGELEMKVKMIEFFVDFLTNSNPDERLVRNVAASPNGRELFSLQKVRRAVKKVMKAKIAREDWSYKHEDLINAWQDSEFDSFTKVWVIKGNTDNAKRVLDEMNVPWEGVEIHSIYDCTGQEFRRPAWFREIGDRTFVTQSGGLDV